MGTYFHRATAALLIPWLVASPGCLSSSYRVASDELSRLARTAPEERWQSVRVTQRMLDSDRPPDGAVQVRIDAPVVVLPPVLWFHGRSWGVPGRWHGNPPPGRVAAPSGGRSGSGSSGGQHGLDAAAVAVAVVVAAGIVFVLAGTEGVRYDGWVGVPPDEMVFLDNPDGSVTALPLTALTPELADRAQGATLYEVDDGRYLHLARAPLNRVGFTVQASVLTAVIPRTDAGTSGGLGVGGRAFFGGFPVRALGFGASADVLADAAGSLVATLGGEAQVMPVLWGGAYLGAGWASLTSDDHARRSGGWFVRVGVHLELPITTRLAASLRAGVTRLDFVASPVVQWMPELSLGLSIY